MTRLEAVKVLEKENEHRQLVWGRDNVSQAFTLTIETLKRIEVEKITQIIADLDTNTDFKIEKNMNKVEILFLVNKTISEQLSQAIVSYLEGK